MKLGCSADLASGQRASARLEVEGFRRPLSKESFRGGRGSRLPSQVELGPLANHVQLKHITELVKDAKAAGGKALARENDPGPTQRSPQEAPSLLSPRRSAPVAAPVLACG